MPDSGASSRWRASGLQALLNALPTRRLRQLVLLTLLTVVVAAAELLVVGTALLFVSALAGNARAGEGVLPLGFGGESVASAAMLFACSVLAADIVRLIYLRLNEHFIAWAAHELTLEVQRRVLAQPYAYHAHHHSSELIASMDKVQVLLVNLANQWLQSVAALATGLAILALLASIDLYPALIAFAALGMLYLAIARIAAARLKANSLALGDAFGGRIRNVQETIGAIRDVKIDHAERAQLEDFHRINARLAAAQASTGFIASAPRFLVEAGAALIIAGLAAWLAANSGGGNALLLVAGVALGGMRVLPLLQTAYRSWATMKGNRALIDDVAGLLGLPMLDEVGDSQEALHFHRSIRLTGVSFRYADREESAVDEVTLEIPRGSRLALAGETGSGKSTLCDLIMGLLDPASGTIEIDDIALRPANIRAWQRNVAHVAQSIFLADTSIARNIALSVPGETPDMERVRTAARLAELDDFIRSLPNGFESQVGERGVRLSGGQRQRIGIARALYKGAPLLVLDEATNALDEETEHRVLANLLADKQRTILIVAHRYSALSHCDRVIELSAGRLVGG